MLRQLQPFCILTDFICHRGRDLDGRRGGDRDTLSEPSRKPGSLGPHVPH
jgi:hypothetical protein